jgi:hypothetical protein
MIFTESQYEQLIDKIDEEPTPIYHPVVEPVGNDDGRITSALMAILTCTNDDLVHVREQLQLAYCAYYNIKSVAPEDDITLEELLGIRPHSVY